MAIGHWSSMGCTRQKETEEWKWCAILKKKKRNYIFNTYPAHDEFPFRLASLARPWVVHISAGRLASSIQLHYLLLYLLHFVNGPRHSATFHWSHFRCERTYREKEGNKCWMFWSRWPILELFNQMAQIHLKSIATGPANGIEATERPTRRWKSRYFNGNFFFAVVLPLPVWLAGSFIRWFVNEFSVDFNYCYFWEWNIMVSTKTERDNGIENIFGFPSTIRWNFLFSIVPISLKTTSNTTAHSV